jgi:hypothetical protein
MIAPFCLDSLGSRVKACDAAAPPIRKLDDMR